MIDEGFSIARVVRARHAMPWRAEFQGIAPRWARRALDIVAGAAGLLIVGLPLLLLMLLVRLSSPGPAIFRQVRVGQGGRPFKLYKLRSMRTGAGGPHYTAAGDTRVTRLGAFLRKTSLDELPQLWNVLIGQMTLVGPRPETPLLAMAYPPECQWVFAHRPGLTGPAQVRMRDADVLGPAGEATDEVYLTRIVPARSHYESAFLSDPTLAATFGVLFDTVRHLLGKPPRGGLGPGASGAPAAQRDHASAGGRVS
jgi:lipopolysaccharide/colanic/teichoic acid biosynthesis glycosyltransferase